MGRRWCSEVLVKAAKMKVVSQGSATDEGTEDGGGKRASNGDGDDIRDRIADFFSSTSIHGMGRIYGVGHWWRKIMWSCFSIAMTTWALYQIVSVAVDYGKYPKKITRSVEKDTPTVFPAVTVCNLSPMPRVDALKDHPTWGVFIQVETSFNDSNECDKNKGEKTKKTTGTNSVEKPLPQREEEEPGLVTQELKIQQTEMFLRALLKQPKNQGGGAGKKGNLKIKRRLVRAWENLTHRHKDELDNQAARHSNATGWMETGGISEGQVGIARRNLRITEDIQEEIRVVLELFATLHFDSLDAKGWNVILDRLERDIRHSRKDHRGSFVHLFNDTNGDGNKTSEARKDSKMRRGDVNSTGTESVRGRFIISSDQSSALPRAGGTSRRAGMTNIAKVPLHKEDLKRELNSAFLLAVSQDLNRTSRQMRSSVSEGECGNGYEACGDGTCYREHKHCDGWSNCANHGDEDNCTCDADHHRCFGKDTLCIHQDLLCDGYGDCLFEDDEMNCDACRAGAWRCNNGRCIRAYLRCDGSEDCAGGEDEVWCGGEAPTCEEEAFPCASSGRCLAAPHRCDGHEHCDDGSDEADCKECAEGLFHCGDDACLPSHFVCDGDVDCGDGADEADCSSWSSECPDDDLHYFCSSAFWPDYCLHPRFVCDGLHDCWDWEEEDCEECSEVASSCGDGTCLQKFQWCDGQENCADGRDETNCTAGCQGMGYHCKGENKCINIAFLCDGDPQCEDGSDEADCGEGCSSEEFQCDNGLCIAKSFICDAVEDCITGEDEEDCESCTPRRFHCKEDNRCIHEHYVCDETHHCSNGSDEYNCVGDCSRGYFACNSGLCVHEAFRCDGVRDCKENEDELNCEVCVDDAFLCPEGRCLSAFLRCDGEPECDSGEDERECSGCRRGVLCEVESISICLPEVNICDGNRDCDSGVDEMMCSQYLVVCPAGYFQCNDSVCLRERYKCDGLSDCPLGEDEIDCDACVDGGHYCAEERRCVPGQILCLDDPLCSSQLQPNCSTQPAAADTECQPGYLWCKGGGCVNYRFLCDGRLHCPDGEDEVNCDNMRDHPLALEVRWIRIMCSRYYTDLLSLQDKTVTEPPSHLSTFTCDGNSYNEIVTWSVICQVGVLCDHYGCYDDSATDYQETFPMQGTMCSICGGTSKVCQPVRWVNDWLLGLLDLETLSIILRKQRGDFTDIAELYAPSRHEQEAYAVPADDFVYSCRFDNTLCDYRDFSTWTSNSYGTCYTFNSGLPAAGAPSTTPRTTSVSGPKNGLRAVFNVQAGLALLSPEDGLRVTVHSPYLRPVPEEEGFNVGPGSSSVAVGRTVFTRLGPPHGRCQPDPSDTLQYSTMMCKLLCLEREYRRRCRCYVLFAPERNDTENDLEDLGARCSLFNTTQKVCMEKIAADDLDGILQCDCPLPCRETQYRSQVTSTRANMLHYELLHKLRKNVASFCSDKMDTVVLHVYLDSISYELIDESPTYTWDTLLCNLGGSLGLFVGVSMLSILEVLELLVDLCILTFSKKKRGRGNKDEWSQDEGELVKVKTPGEKNVNIAWKSEGSVRKCSGKCASQFELEVLKEEIQHLKMAFTTHTKEAKAISEGRQHLTQEQQNKDLNKAFHTLFMNQEQ
ncbi:uncharacterized protein LOC122266299 [Penaeus japonicus]|uniref:uncharacterized protein LOC122266299 n=1 Tax=Penaeus japonicus TaxID=27405 RepID=UPI001C70F179|nr:uncharacterized protein LOC122266299 [Penaeus japonicus]